MVYVLKGIEEKWIPRTEIKEMGDFLLRHPRHLYPLHNSITQTRCVSHLRQKLELAIGEAISYGMIKRGDVTDQFATLSTRFIKLDLAKPGSARGALLEYLCYSRGPFRHRTDVGGISRLRKCTLQNQQGGTQCGDNNIDVGFVHASVGILELQECKYRLSNFLDGSSATGRKLDYMKCVQQCISGGSFCAQVVFVSMQFDLRREKDVLKQMGLDFVCFGFDDVLSLIA